MSEHREDAFDADLRRLLQAGEEPADDGFTLRVMASLPDASQGRAGAGSDWGPCAHWAAISVAAVAAATLLDPSRGPMDSPTQLAAYALLALLVFWSIPSRWSRP